MDSIPRAALLQALGWTERQDHEGMLRWSQPQATPPGLDFATVALRVIHEPGRILARLDWEQGAEFSEPESISLLLAQFDADPDRPEAVALASFSQAGVPDAEPAGRLRRCLDAFSQARQAMEGTAPSQLLLDPMPGIRLGMSI